MKIAIIGSPGSGKSTLALQLHKIFNIPLFHLDQYFWKPNWQRPDRNEFKKIHDALCDQKEWIMEGMAISHFEYRIQQADIIIFLDIPTYICFYRIFKRALLNFGKVFFSSAPECPERLPSWEFLKYTWNFNTKQKMEVKKFFDHYKNQKRFFIIKNRSDINNVIHNIETIKT